MPIVRNDGPQVAGNQSSRSQRNGGGSSGSRGRAAAGAASEQGQEVVGEARAQGQEVAAVATDQAREVAGLVREQATQLTQDLSEQGRTLYEETRQQVAEQADVQTQALAQTLHRWGAESQALVEGRPADAGTVGVCVRQCADRLYQAASEIEIRGASGLLEEAQDFARRRPGAFLFGAALIGFGGGRLLRGAKMDQDERGTDGSLAAGGAIDYEARPSRSRSDGSGRGSDSVGASRGPRRNPAASGGE